MMRLSYRCLIDRNAETAWGCEERSEMEKFISTLVTINRSRYQNGGPHEFPKKLVKIQQPTMWQMHHQRVYPIESKVNLSIICRITELSPFFRCFFHCFFQTAVLIKCMVIRIHPDIFSLLWLLCDCDHQWNRISFLIIQWSRPVVET